MGESLGKRSMLNLNTGVTLRLEDVIEVVNDSIVSLCNRISSLDGHLPINSLPLTLKLVTKYCEDNKEIELWYRPLPHSIKGLTINQNGIFIIICNSKETNHLIRLKIILHELGHYLLHRDFLEKVKFTHKSGGWFDERFEKEANLFALMAIIPDSLCEIILKNKNIEIGIDYLEDIYQYTREEAVIRIAAYDSELRFKTYEEILKLHVKENYNA